MKAIKMILEHNTNIMGSVKGIIFKNFRKFSIIWNNFKHIKLGPNLGGTVKLIYKASTTNSSSETCI